MKKMILILALALATQAQARGGMGTGLALGMAGGMLMHSAIASANNNNSGNVPSLHVDITSPTLVCKANYEMSDCRYDKVGVLVKQRGYHYYTRREVILTGNENYLVFNMYKSNPFKQLPTVNK